MLYGAFVAVLAAFVFVFAITIFWGSGIPVTKKDISTEKTDAIILLAGSYEERLLSVVGLYADGYSDKIILTNDGVKRGWLLSHQKNLYAVERCELDLILKGIPQQAIIKLPFFKSGTVYDALMVRNYVKKHKLKSIIIVTSDYHTRRAYWIFERVLRDQKISIGIYPAISRVGFWGLMKEMIKSIYYTMMYGLLGFIPSQDFSDCPQPR